jgi:hypothetical protein
MNHLSTRRLRTIGALIATALLFVGVSLAVLNACLAVERAYDVGRHWEHWQYLGPVWFEQRWSSVPRFLLPLPFTLVLPLGMALYVYHRLVFPGAWLDGRTRCGRCAAVLKDLAEPRCPFCGARF